MSLLTAELFNLNLKTDAELILNSTRTGTLVQSFVRHTSAALNESHLLKGAGGMIAHLGLGTLG